jgi:hypothetical protein
MNQVNPIGSQRGFMPIGRRGAYCSASLMCIGAFLGACSSGLGRVDGAVIDVTDHNLPLPDATVVAVRETDVFALVESRLVCEDLRITHTDEQGRFHFEPWFPPHQSLWRQIFPGNHWTTLTVYKRGFAAEHGGPSVPVNDQYTGVIRQKKLDESFEHQVNYIFAVSREIPCVGGDFHRLQRPLLRQLETDAVALAGTPEQLQYANAKFGLSAGSQSQQSPQPSPVQDFAAKPPTSRAETR